jgi:predicted alpha/beta superfamily hydrolase
MNPFPGSLHRHADFASRHVQARHVEVWIPPGLEASASRCPVLYLQDGQNLFAPGSAYGGVDWGVAPILMDLMQAGRIPATIVVGIWNTSERWREYMPQQAFPHLTGRRLLAEYLQRAGGTPTSDNYLRFLVEELKPFIDRTYPSLPDQPHTFVMGSSMGGLISLYALEQYPGLFGGAGCLSTHWPAGKARLVDYLGRHLPPAGHHKLYFDFGTATLDAAYEPYQRRMDGHLIKHGFTPDGDWMTRKFEGAAHNEASWRERLHLPLEFLLGRT